MNYIENLNDLFSDDNKKIYKAIFEKKNWINRKIIKPIFLYPSLDENNEEHFYELENLLNKVVKFEKFYDINLCYFDNTVNLNSGAFIYAEYDLNMIDDSLYKLLMPNFYITTKVDKLEYEENKVKEDTFLQLKIALNNTKHSYFIALDDSQLLHSKFYLPYISKIFYVKGIDCSLINELLIFGKENNIIIEEINEN